METTWNLKQLYQSENDPQLEKDIKRSNTVVQQFVSKYKGSNKHLNQEDLLLVALTEFEKVVEFIDAPKPLIYFYLRKFLNSSDTLVEAKINQLTDYYTKLENEILFFTLEIGLITEKKQKYFLNSTKLKHYHYFLHTTFEEAKYHLSENEEKIMNLKSLPSYSLWVSGGEKILNKQTVRYESKDIPLQEAINKIPTIDTKNRRILHRKVLTKLIEISDYSECEINAVVINKKINDEIRGFKNAYDSRLLSDEVKENEISSMIDAVTDNFAVSHKFYDLKSKLLNIRKPHYSDRNAEYKKMNKNFSYIDTAEIVKSIYNDLGDNYINVFNKLSNGQIDVNPKKGKSGGAFCLGTINNPTYVLLNHTDDYQSVITLGHELGHAVHSEFSKAQTPIYQYYSTVTAETASTLFEDFVFEKISQSVSNEDKIVLMHNKINNDISSIFRQVALFNFEKELHKKIRDIGFLSKEEISKIMNKHMQSYLGPKFKLTSQDGYYFVVWSHIRDFFYVYSYSYGKLVSKALYQRYKNDKSFLAEIEKFLKAGGSKSPHDIFKEVGVDTNDINFWKEGLNRIETEINVLEDLING